MIDVASQEIRFLHGCADCGVYWALALYSYASQAGHHLSHVALIPEPTGPREAQTFNESTQTASAQLISAALL